MQYYQLKTTQEPFFSDRILKLANTEKLSILSHLSLKNNQVNIFGSILHHVLIKQLDTIPST